MSKFQLSSSDVALANGFRVTNSKNPGTAGEFVLFRGPMPQAIRAAFHQEEVDWGYSEDYIALSDAKRAKLYPVWLSDTGIAIGGTLSSTAGLRPIDAMVGKLLVSSGTTQHMGSGHDMLVSLSPSADWFFTDFPYLGFRCDPSNQLVNSGWPDLHVDMEGSGHAVFDSASIASWATKLLGETVQPSQVVQAFHGWEPGFLAGTSDPLVIHNQVYRSFLGGPVGEDYDRFTMVVHDAEGYGVYVSLTGISQNVLTRGLHFRAIHPISATLSMTRCALGDIRIHRALWNTLSVPETSAWGPWVEGISLGGQPGRGMISLGSAGFELYGSELVAGAFTQVGPAKVGLFAVIGLPPLADCVHVIGDVDMITDPSVIAIKQTLLAFDWKGKGLEVINPSLTDIQRSRLARLDVRSVYNLTGVWTVPSDPLSKTEFERDALAAGASMKSEIYTEADPDSGTPKLTFKQASDRASLKQYSILHHFRSLVTWDLVSKVAYTGNLSLGYSGVIYDQDGGVTAWDQALALNAVRNGCTEDFTAAVGEQEWVREAVLGMTKAEWTGLDTGAVTLDSPEMVEDGFFSHAEIPNPDSEFPLNMRAAVGLRFFNPVRSQFNEVANSMFALMRNQATRFKS